VYTAPQSTLKYRVLDLTIPKHKQNALKKPAQQNKDVRRSFTNSCQESNQYLFKKYPAPRVSIFLASYTVNYDPTFVELKFIFHVTINVYGIFTAKILLHNPPNRKILSP
jgi:hypothetical protein